MNSHCCKCHCCLIGHDALQMLEMCGSCFDQYKKGACDKFSGKAKSKKIFKGSDV